MFMRLLLIPLPLFFTAFAILQDMVMFLASEKRVGLMIDALQVVFN